jgi:hypothetical protein
MGHLHFGRYGRVRRGRVMVSGGDPKRGKLCARTVYVSVPDFHRKVAGITKEVGRWLSLV